MDIGTAPVVVRFTLTMWDVKKFKPGRFCMTNISFTLTMWDVKYSNTNISNTNKDKFYLNYVGCKEETYQVFWCRRWRFTLTMWDVKIITTFCQ